MRFKILAFVLAAVLALGLSACGPKDADGSSAASGGSSSSSSASASTEAEDGKEEGSSSLSGGEGSSGRPQSSTVTITVEGEEEDLPVVLFEGAGYSIYLPEDEWTRTAEGEDGAVRDLFTAVENDKVLLAVQSPADETITFEEVCEALLAEGYLQSDDNDRYFALSADGAVTCQYIVEAEDGRVWTLSWCYPDTTEYLEGWGSRIPQLIETFQAD